MEVLSPSFSTTITSISNKFPIQISYSTVNVFNPTNNKNHTKLSLSSSQSSPFSYVFSSRTKATVTASITTPLTSPPISSNKTGNRHWMVLMESPPHGVNSKPQIVDYYVKTLERVLGRWVCFNTWPAWAIVGFGANLLCGFDSEKYAQMCIYDVSCDTHFGFCCDIDEEASRELASMFLFLSYLCCLYCSFFLLKLLK